MSKTNTKQTARLRRKRSIRKRISGSEARPRIAIFRSSKHIYAQVIDDGTGRTLASASTLSPELKGQTFEGKKEAAEAVGKLLAEKAKAANITQAVFDRGGYLYHGRVAALADGARSGGLEFFDRSQESIMARMNRRRRDEEESNLIEKVIYINRVAKVVKGGRRFSFSAIVVVGDGAGTVGVGFGKANEVPEAIRKGIERAKKSMFAVPLVGATLPHEVLGRFGAGRVLIKPASPGTGVIAGPTVRAIMEALGVTDTLTKSLRSSNPHNVVRATFDALRRLESIEQYGARTGQDVDRFMQNYTVTHDGTPAAQ